MVQNHSRGQIELNPRNKCQKAELHLRVQTLGDFLPNTQYGDWQLSEPSGKLTFLLTTEVSYASVWPAGNPPSIKVQVYYLSCQAVALP